MNRTLIACAAAGALASGAAFADTTVPAQSHGSPSFVRVEYTQPYAPPTSRWDDRALTVNQREDRIKAQIHGGVSDGRITYRESRSLLRQLAGVESKERSYRADGRLDRRETADLNRDLDRVALNVRTQLRDNDRRY